MESFYRKSIIARAFIQVLVFVGIQYTTFAINPLIRIKVSGIVYSDETIVRYNPAATTGFDFQYDASKIMSTGTTPSIYSIIGTKKYAINTLPSPDSLLTLQLGCKILQTGTYTMTFVNSTDMHGYFLYDKFLSSEIPIDSSTVYTFSGAVGDAQGRFELRYRNTNNNLNFTVLNNFTVLDNVEAKEISEVFVGSCIGGMFVSFKNRIPENYIIQVIGQGGRVLKIVERAGTVLESEFVALDDLSAGSYIVLIHTDDADSSCQISLL